MSRRPHVCIECFDFVEECGHTDRPNMYRHQDQGGESDKAPRLFRADVMAEIHEKLQTLPTRMLEQERKNPAWSKAELWGIERDIVPQVRLMCLELQRMIEPYLSQHHE